MALLSGSKKRPKARAKTTTRRKKRSETRVEALLRARGSETLGFGLLVLALLLVAGFATYSPDDPSFFNQTDHPTDNLLGSFGSYTTDIFHRVLGVAMWLLPLLFFIWSGRLMLHIGGERVVRRMVIAPIAVALAAVLVSTYVPNTGWRYEYGLGGILGDTVLQNFLGVVPLELGLSLKLATLVLALGLLGLGLYVAAVNRAEARLGLQYFFAGLVVVYMGVRGVVATVVPSMAVGVRKGAGSLGAGLSVAGQKGLGAAQAAKQQARQNRAAQKAAQKATKTDQQNRFGDRLDALRSKNGDDTPARRPDTASLLARISSSRRPDNGDDTLDDGAVLDDTPRLGGVRRAIGPVPDPQAAVPAPARVVPKPEPRVRHPDGKPIPKSKKALAEEQPTLGLEPKPNGGYEAPPLSLLENPVNVVRQNLSDDALNANARMLETVLDDYGVKGEIVRVRPGPVVTMYELEPAAGLKASRVIGLADDIARSMSALAARVSTVPGRSIIGIELPNEIREMVLLREIFAARAFGDSKHKLPMALGKDIGGEPVVVNLAKCRIC